MLRFLVSASRPLVIVVVVASNVDDLIGAEFDDAALVARVLLPLLIAGGVVSEDHRGDVGSVGASSLLLYGH